jgi:hypothetical protein
MFRKKVFRTPNFSTIQNVCMQAQSQSEMLAIVGYPGAGKTTSFENYIQKNDNVYYIRVRPTMKSKQFYRALAGAVGCEIHNDLDLFSLMDIICNQLNSTYEKKLIIIDEGGKLKPRFLEYIHELRDLTILTTGIVLAGPEYFKENVDEWVKKGIIGIPEFERRVFHWEILDPLSKNEITDFITAYGITDKDFLKQQRKLCKTYSKLENQIKIFTEENSQKN